MHAFLKFVLLLSLVVLGSANLTLAKKGKKGKAKTADGSLCKTGFGTPGDSNYKKCWTAVFARAQPDQANNPNKATYKSDWKAATKAYPELKKIAKPVHSKVKSFWSKKVNTKKMNLRVPFTRVCVPSEYGLKKCGLKEGMISARVNPNGYQTDAKSKVFIKLFYDSKSGKLVSGQTGH